MSVTIIQNPALALTDACVQYLSLNSSASFTISDNLNTAVTIQSDYDKGVRKFVLALYSSEILQLLPLITSLADAKFVATASTVIELRGAAPNLYFNCPSNTYIEVVAEITSLFKSIACVVYDDLSDPFVKSVVDIFAANGFATANVTDVAIWQPYRDLMVVSLDVDQIIWKIIVDNLLPLPKQYTIFSIETTPPDYVDATINITNVAIFFPISTASSQLNSYWNIAAKPAWTISTPWYDIVPFLTNLDWDSLIQTNLISQTLQLNGTTTSRYVKDSALHPHFNLQNPYVLTKPTGYIWLIADQYVTPYTRANLKYLKANNPLICRIRTTSDIVHSVKKYWCQGYRQFVLQAPSDDVAKVEKLNLCGGVFVCTRSSSPTVRKPGSPFIFGLADDNTMIQDRIYGRFKTTQGKIVCVLGTSDNVNIPDFRAQLDKLAIPWVNIDQLDSIHHDITGVYSVGNLDDFQTVLDYVIANRVKFPALASVQNYGSYITQAQYDLVQQTFPTVKNFVFNQYNSSQPFLDSEYSVISRPSYLPNDVIFFDLSNILLRFPLSFLFAFGYVVDA